MDEVPMIKIVGRDGETQIVRADSEFWWERDERNEAEREKALAKARSIRGNGRVPRGVKIRSFEV